MGFLRLFKEWVFFHREILIVALTRPRVWLVVILIFVFALLVYLIFSTPAVAVPVKHFFAKTLPKLAFSLKAFVVAKGPAHLSIAAAKHAGKAVVITGASVSMSVQRRRKLLLLKEVYTAKFKDAFGALWQRHKKRWNENLWYKAVIIVTLVLLGFVIPILHLFAWLMIPLTWLTTPFRWLLKLVFHFFPRLAAGQVVKRAYGQLMALLWRVVPEDWRSNYVRWKYSMLKDVVIRRRRVYMQTGQWLEYRAARWLAAKERRKTKRRERRLRRIRERSARNKSQTDM